MPLYNPSGGTATHPDLATHDSMGLATDDELTTHIADTTNIHGITDTSVLATDTEVATAVSGHAADTTSVHGITDTSALETTTGSAAKVEAHRADTTDVHGILNTANLVLTDDARLTDQRVPTTHDILTKHNGFPGGTTDFLRADGSFATPPSSGGASTLPALTDVADATAPTTAGHLLRANGTAWINSALQDSDIPSTIMRDSELTKASIDALNVDADTLDGVDSAGFATVAHTHALDDLSDVNLTGAADGQVLKRSGGVWVPAADATGGGGGGATSTLIKKSADQLVTGTAFADISEFVVACAALEVKTIDALLVFSSSVGTHGFKFAVTTPGWTPTRFLATFEYQTSATAWATFTQTSPTTFMAATAATYVAGSGVMCRALVQVEAGATGGNIQLQAGGETAAGVITIRKGNSLRYM